MCGICGFLNASMAPAEPGTLRAMRETIAHRGPDEAGEWIEGPCALGIRRLRVIDLATGSQPVFNEDGRVGVVFNGEIYNYRELREELRAHGHRFTTNSDTETLVHAYEEWGDDFVARLNGMFAIALWDSARRRLLLARDRFGKKPLYYCRTKNGGVIFGSELKCLLKHPESPSRAPDWTAIHHYLSLQYVPDPLTAFDNIHKLLPAHLLVFEADNLTQTSTPLRYWRLAYEPKHATGKIGAHSEVELAVELRDRVRSAVAARLVSDVPLGCFLSGGIDSSIVALCMAEAASGRVKTFSIGFEEEAFSELPHAREVAKRIGADHHEFVVPFAPAEMLETLVDTFDEPFADSSALPTWHLSKLTRQHVTVALTGDGGDETHAGYQRYWLDRAIAPFVKLPRWIQSAIFGLANKIPEPQNIPIERNIIAGARRLEQVARISPKASILRWGSYFSDTMKSLGYTQRMRLMALPDSELLLSAIFENASAENFLDRSLQTDVESYLAGDLLVKVDRMTMAHSLEARSPFLDHRLAEWTARLPPRMKLRGRSGKHLLKRAFSADLPAAILNRPKQGFGIPVSKWMRGSMRPLVAELLLGGRFDRREILRPEYTQSLIAEHNANKADHGKRLWTLVMLELWFRRYID